MHNYFDVQKNCFARMLWTDCSDYRTHL